MKSKALSQLATLFFLLIALGQLSAQHPSRPPLRSVPPARASGIGKPPAPPKQTAEDRIERLEKMSPDERRAALDRLPADRRERIEKRLDRLEHMTPAQRAKLNERLEQFKNLTAEQQKQVRQISQELQGLPGRRKVAIRQELDVLKTLPENERQSRMLNPAWKKQFAPNEQEILNQSTALFPEQP